MNTTNTREEPRLAGGWPEFLATLERLYRLLGLDPEAARAATVADAESFGPRPEEARLAA